MKKQLSDSALIARIEALEQAVFGAKPKKRALPPDGFKGATGGLRLLLSKRSFDRRRQFSEIETALNEQGYHYSKQAIRTPLNRMSLQNGPLVGLREHGHKVYAKRK